MNLDLTTKVRPTKATDEVNVLVAATLFYLGLSEPLQRWLDVTVLRWPATTVVGAVVALYALPRIRNTKSMKRYLSVALAFAFWLLLSTVIAWNGLAFYRMRLLVLWIVLIVPGLAALLRSRRARSALIGGLISGNVVLSLVATERLVRGRVATDVAEGAVRNATLLGINRNVAAGIVLIALPLVVFGRGPKLLTRFRWPILAVSVTWLVFSGGRLALIGLFFVVLVATLVRPGATRKAQALYAAVLIALFGSLALQTFGGPSLVSVERLSKAVHGQESTGDETRRLLLDKSWDLAKKHPWFGVGLGSFQGAYDSAVDEGSTDYVRQHVLSAPAHNEYAQLMAEAGFPALFFFVLIFLQMFRSARGRFSDLDVRAMFCVVSVAVLSLFFELMTNQLLGMLLALFLSGVTSLDLQFGRPTARDQVEKVVLE